MAHWKKSFPSKFLQVSDLDTPIVVVIASVGEENVGEEGKLVARFEKPAIKLLVLNQTRSEAIENIAGHGDIDHWPGTRIQVQRGWTRFQGKRVSCIEVVAPSTPATPAAATAADDDDVAF